MERVRYYFGAGPATLPQTLLCEAQPALLNWKNTGLSILEVGHRTAVFEALLYEAEADLRRILNIPNHYEVLFLGGAARTQFAMVPLNLIDKRQARAAYICNGVWSRMAFEEGVRFANAYVLSEADNLLQETAYVYYTPNETIDGIRYPGVPAVHGVPLVADMTSCLLSEPIDVSQYALIFAGAQKNIAPAGLTVVILRKDLLDILPYHVVPTMLDYRVHAKHRSLYATPPVFQCDMAARMFKWIEAQGGIEKLYAINQLKAAKLYDYIDASPHYTCAIEKQYRSLMNVCFSMTDPNKEVDFLDAAAKAGLTGLKGHRLRGGLRASLYNAMPLEGVEALIAFMDAFI